MLKQLIDCREIGLRSLTEAIDATPAGDSLIFHMFAALAEFERGRSRADLGWRAGSAGAWPKGRQATSAGGRGLGSSEGDVEWLRHYGE